MTSTHVQCAPVEAIYLLTHKYYLRQTRICVASIRYWYPDIPIFLIKDRIAGDFSTKEIERLWNAQEFPTEVKKFGWGFAHLEPLLKPGGERALVMDVDIAFVGRVLDRLAARTEDFVLHREDQTQNPSGAFDKLYFSLDKLQRFDPSFRFPGFSFNAGQFVVTTGKLSRSDFEGLIDWGSPRSVLRPEIFNRGDQGVLNYVVMKKYLSGDVTVARIPFMVWDPEEMTQFDLARIDADSPYGQLIHWAGLRKPRMRDMPRFDILSKFESLYYSRVPLGSLRRRIRLTGSVAGNIRQRVLGKITKRYLPLYLT